MRILICDDNPEVLRELERLFLAYGGSHSGLPFEIKAFPDIPLLHKAQQKGAADVYVLDTASSQVTGIDMGDGLREDSGKVLEALGYALSHMEGGKEAPCLAKEKGGKEMACLAKEKGGKEMACLVKEKGGKEASYLVKTKGGMESILYSEIEFIENASRRLEVHLTDQRKITSVYIRKSFEREIWELIDAGNFICTHKSFLINMDYVRALRQNVVVMESGISVPVSRKYSLDVKKKYCKGTMLS